MDQWKLVAAGGAIAVVGMCAGGWLFQTESASAQPAVYRQCMFGRQETHDINNEGQFEAQRLERTILVPPGWEVVSGAGTGHVSVATILICRR